MQISCAFPPSLETPDHIARAEELGYARAWCYDAPALLSDVWMSLARAADRTERIGLGPAVLCPSYRHVMVTASAIATLEGLAPGRVAVVVGTGFGRRMMGQGLLGWGEVAAYIEALRDLLQGKDVEWEGSVTRMLHPHGFVAERPVDIPILVAAEGPTGLEVARRLGDGVVSTRHPKAGFSWSAVQLLGIVLPDDSPPDPDRVLAAAGPGAAALYHVTYELWGERVDRLPDGAAWRASIEAEPAATRHLVLHGKHLVGLIDADQAVITPELAVKMTFSGKASELRSRLTALEEEGATEIIYQPCGPDVPGELGAFADIAGMG